MACKYPQGNWRESCEEAWRSIQAHGLQTA